MTDRSRQRVPRAEWLQNTPAAQRHFNALGAIHHEALQAAARLAVPLVEIGNGSLAAGLKVLHKFVLRVRAEHVAQLKKLKPPRV